MEKSDSTVSLGPMHVEPIIKEKLLERQHNLFVEHTVQTQGLESDGRIIPLNDLFETGSSRIPVKTVVLCGTVGTGKSTVVKKLVTAWCSKKLDKFSLIVPFSCEDLSLEKKPITFNKLICKKYLHLRSLLPDISSGKLQNVLFIFSDMERMKLDFQQARTELCSDPDEPLMPDAIIVNLLRKYLLPEVNVLITMRPSALEQIPSTYIGLCAQIYGFSDTERQKMYFMDVLQQSEYGICDTENHMEMLYRNLERQNQLAVTCFLPSYCWLISAMLRFLHFSSPSVPLGTLTGMYTTFLYTNIGGEILDSSSPDQMSLVRYVAKTVGRLAYEGIKQKKTSFSEEDLREYLEVEMKTEQELNQLNIFRSDVFSFFLTPCVQQREERFVFNIPAMQEYLAAMHIVLDERRTTLQRIGKDVSEVIQKASEDLSALLNILAKYLPLRLFTLLNLLRMFPRLYGKLGGKSKSRIARTVAVEMFEEEEEQNDDVLDQISASVLGVEGPVSSTGEEKHIEAFELFPMFMGGLLSQDNRNLLDHLGCTIPNFAVHEITKALKNHLITNSQKKLPSSELMDFFFFLYEFQNPHFTCEVVKSLKRINLSSSRMTFLKCFILSSVLSCCNHVVEELDMSSSNLTTEALKALIPLLRHCVNVNLQRNTLGPEACVEFKRLLLDKECTIKTLSLCGNPISNIGVQHLAEGIAGNETLSHLSLLHTSLGDEGVRVLTSHIGKNQHLKELNLAFNSISDSAALELIEVARNHSSLEKIDLYVNDISADGKKSLHAVSKQREGLNVLVSLTEGTDVSQHWKLIFNAVEKNAGLLEQKALFGHLDLLLKDLENGREHTGNLLKKIKFLKAEKEVRKLQKKLKH
ncbi:NLR family member X1 isoform X2 [Protopterus annectens]|nr:NLR family member X1 isoform X2 [Protopterus annectens]